jgi:phage terminase large subunit
MGVDDCQRVPGLKCLLLRKVGKANLEGLDDLRRRLFAGLKYSFNASRGLLTFENSSRIVIGHFQHEKDIDSYLGLEYDVIGIEEATTLTERKYQDIRSCLRTSRPDWRPRLYATTNPGGVGHEWFRQNFVLPFQRKAETDTRFIPARVDDNQFNNPEYKAVLAGYTGWKKSAWYDGNFDIPSGVYFSNFRSEVHVLQDFNDNNGVDWFIALDYGYTHNTVALLCCFDQSGNLIIVDEHVGRNMIPREHLDAIKAMLQRHQISPDRKPPVPMQISCLPVHHRRYLSRLLVGGDLFQHESSGTTIASHFTGLGVTPRVANTRRVEGWTAILERLGNPDDGINPSLFIHKRCTRLLNTLPYLLHNPDLPSDVLKTNPNEEGLGGDDAADALRYAVATPANRIYERKLSGF